MKSNMKKHTRTSALLAGLLVVSACGDGGFGTFYREAGSQLDTGDFGRATLHNQLVQTCRTNGTGFASAKGTVAGDPVVVLDPKSSYNNPVYRVHCNGKLDGKYARIIYGQYVSSAIPRNTVEDAGE